MGLNFEAACRRCHVRLYIYRGHESEALHEFFQQHASCARRSGWDTVRVLTDGSYTDPPEGSFDGYSVSEFPPQPG